MTDELERRWDDAVEEAWRAHRSRLADRLAALAPGDEVVLAAGCTVSSRDDVLRLVVVAGEGADATALAALGLTPGPDDAVRTADLGRREVDRAAWVLVTALREVLGVVHPSFLDGEAAEVAAAAAEEVAAPVAEAPDADYPPPGDPGPWSPRDSRQVRAAVHRVARDVVDAEPAWDDDGELGLHTDAAVLWVVVARRVPRLLLTATLLGDVVDEARALVEVNLLTAEHVGLGFHLEEGRVVVRRELSVAALDPASLRAELLRLLHGLDGWTADLQARVGGRGLHDERVVLPADRRGAARGEAGEPGGPDGREDERFAAAYAVMTELEREDGDGLDPATLVRVFGGERSLLMTAIAQTRARERVWVRRAREREEAGNERTSRAAASRARHHARLRARLRRALRLTVDGRRGETQEQLTLFELGVDAGVEAGVETGVETGDASS